MEFKEIESKYDKGLAELIRTILKKHGLDIPGTAYFDEGLDHLSEVYSMPESEYYVLIKDDKLKGGIGFAAFDGIDNCAELQKLYLNEGEQGKGTGYEMIRFIEEKAGEAGFKKMYLETHTNLKAAIHIYEKSGYREIERPKSVIHSTMNRFYIKELEHNG